MRGGAEAGLRDTYLLGAWRAHPLDYREMSTSTSGGKMGSNICAEKKKQEAKNAIPKIHMAKKKLIGLPAVTPLP